MTAIRLKLTVEAGPSVTLETLQRVDRTRPLREQIYSLIRRSILTGEFAPGAIIDEKAIAASLSVSRTPVREALKKPMKIS